MRTKILSGNSVPRKSFSRKHHIAIYSLTIWVAVLAARVIAGNWESKFPIVFPDSFSFIEIAHRGFLSPHFWFGERPLLTPFILRSVGGGVREFVLFQTLLYFMAAALLCYTSLRILKSHIAQAMSVICIFAVVIQSRYALWNTHVLSESLSMSTSLLTISAWLWYSHVRTNRSMALAWITSVLWMLARDSNAATTLFIVVCVIAVPRILRPRTARPLNKSFRLGALAILLIGVFSYVGQNISGRNDNPVMNNIGQRVLPDPQLLDWYEGRGMPVSDSLLERTGKNAFDDQWKMLTELDLEQFREWSRDSGQMWQMVSFIRFAPHWINQSLGELDSELAYDNHDYDVFDTAEKLPDGSWLGIGGPQSELALLIWLLLALISLSLIWRSQNRIRASVLTVLLLSSFVDYTVSWVGDSVEVNRHLVGCFFRTSIILGVVLACGVNAFLTEIHKQVLPDVTE